jgi:hypothetical protein
MSSLFQLELSGLTESVNSTIKSKFVISRKKELNVDFIVKNRLSLTKKGVVRRALDDTDGLQASNFETYQIVQPNDLIFRLIDLEKNTGRRVALGRNIEAMRKLLKEYRSAIITAAVTGQIEIPEVIT